MALPFKKLLSCKDAQQPLVWWEQAFGRDFPAVRPFLIPCTGKRADFYPCPDDPAVQLMVRESGTKYRAVPTGENADDFDDLELNWEDVQAHRFNPQAFIDFVRDGFGVKQRLFQPLENLHPVGLCSATNRSVYACLDTNAEKVLLAVAPIAGPETAGCVLFPECIPAIAPLLQGRGVATVYLDEACGGDSVTCGRKCARLKSELSRQIEEIKRERIEDFIKLDSRQKVIEAMAEGPEKFIAGLRARLSGKEADLFTILIHKESDEYGTLRLLSYAEIGDRLKKRVSKQAVGAQYKKLEETHPDVWAFVEAIRNPGKDTVYSGLSPSERRELGIDEAYNYDAG